MKTYFNFLKPLLVVTVVAALFLVGNGCEDKSKVAQFKSKDGKVTIDGPQDGVVAKGDDGGTKLENDASAKKLAKKLKDLLKKIQDSGVLDELSRELEEAGILVAPDGVGNTPTGDAGGNTPTGTTGNSTTAGSGKPQAIAKLNIIIELMKNMEALMAQIEKDLTADQVGQVKKQMEDHKKNGTFSAGVTYVRPDGTVVVKLLAFTVFMGEDAELIGTLIHELTHVELRGYDLTGKKIEPPVDASGHGGKFVEVFEKLIKLYRQWLEKQN